MTRKFAVLLLLIIGLPSFADEGTISLAGEWRFALDPEGTMTVTSPLNDVVTLPGTTDTNRKGTPAPLTSAPLSVSPRGDDVTSHLSRRYTYKGRAWYEREVVIPKDWRKRTLQLFLERTKPTWLYVDGQFVDSCNNISTPHRFLLPKLKTGRHTIRLLIDNASGVPEQVYGSSHAYTEDTQTNWNGVIGKICLTAEGRCLTAEGRCLTAEGRCLTAEGRCLMADIAPLTVQGQHFYDAKGHRVFLRGKHDACVWPLTGHCPMDVATWKAYFTTCKDYGINHVRFHSWCPPEAAFVAADELGVWLQPELPFWGDFNAKDSVLMSFLHKEGVNIMREYSRHPSFAMFALGNELWGSIEEMAHFVQDFRMLAPQVLFTFGSNYYLGYQGVKPGMDYFTTCRVGGEAWGTYDTHTRGSFSFADAKTGGMLNTEYPNTLMTLETGCSKSDVPVVSHETGQFQTYPDYNEIKKYTGVLYPCNMEVFRARLDSAGMSDQAQDFHRASGLWSVQLYKADIELDLRTPSMAGFQLLDLQDYPGQGSAYVGVLDAFMESKGLCTASEWRQFCNDVVPLALLPAYTYTSGQRQQIEVKIANYSGRSMQGKKLHWIAGNMEGDLAVPDGEGLLSVGEIPFEAPIVHTGVRLTMTLIIDGTSYLNTYNLWVYPSKVALDAGDVVVTRRMTAETGALLEAGRKVLWMPDSTQLQGNTVGPLFQTDYWNYRMFKTICENNKKPVSPGTLGILTNPKHPLFAEFPTEEHTNWQWFPVISNSNPMILDHFSHDYRPIVQVIDNIERNHKLGLVFELAVGKGKLLVCMSDLERAKAYPEGRQFYHSLLSYMQSADFQPQHEISYRDLMRLLTTDVKKTKLKELNNISPY